MRKHLLYILCGMLLLTGCDYLNRVPEKDIETVESLFEQRTKAESWWKGLYGEVNTVLTSLTNNTSFLGADEFVTCQALYNSTTFRLDGLKVADGLQMSRCGTRCTRLFGTRILFWRISIILTILPTKTGNGGKLT